MTVILLLSPMISEHRCSTLAKKSTKAEHLKSREGLLRSPVLSRHSCLRYCCRNNRGVEY